jgi:hypothetical protein
LKAGLEAAAGSDCGTFITEVPVVSGHIPQGGARCKRGEGGGRAVRGLEPPGRPCRMG